MKPVAIAIMALTCIQAAALAQSSIESHAFDSANSSSQGGRWRASSNVRASGSDVAEQGSDTSLKRNVGLGDPAPLVLVDASGKIAGLYLPASRTVVLHVRDAAIAASITNQLDVNTPYSSLGQQSGSTYRWTVQEQTWFPSADCSGPPIPLAISGLRPVAYTQDRTTGSLTAFIGGTGNSTPRPANSVRQPSLGLGPLSGQCIQETPFGGVIQGFDVEQTVVLSQRFAEPLTLR